MASTTICIETPTSVCSDGTCPPNAICTTDPIQPKPTGSTAAVPEGETFYLHAAAYVFQSSFEFDDGAVHALPLAVNQNAIVTAEGEPNSLAECVRVHPYLDAEEKDPDPHFHEGYISYRLRFNTRDAGDNQLPRTVMLALRAPDGWIAWAMVDVYPQSLLLRDRTRGL